MLKKLKLFLLLLSVFTLSGCATFESSYPNQMHSVKSDLANNQPESAYKNLQNKFRHDSTLYNLEQGRLEQLNNKPQISLQAYAKVIQTIQTDRMKAKIQASKILENTGALLTNDRELPFETPDYAMTFLYAYQALNYLSLKDLSNAVVSIRQLSQAQSWIRQQQDIANQSTHIINEKYRNQEIDMDSLDFKKSQQIQFMYNQTQNITNAYENGFSYYLASLLYMTYGDYNNAMVSIKDAHRLLPDNRYVRQTYEEIEHGFNGSSSLPKDKGRLVILYEQDFVESKKAFQLPLFLGRLGAQMISTPYYSGDSSHLHPFYISIKDKKNKTLLVEQQSGELLTNTTKMAMKSLTEAYPAIITREALRLIIKSTATYALQREDRKRNRNQFNWALLGASIYNLVTAKADQRSWLLLPSNIQLYEKPLSSGTYDVKINNLHHSVNINTQRTTLVWVIQVGEFHKIFYFEL